MSKITKSARDEDCLVRIPGYCNYDISTTVFAHKNGSGNFGGKSSDMLGAYACSACHDLVDGRSKPYNYSGSALKLMFYEGIFRTQLKLKAKGLLC